MNTVVDAQAKKYNFSLILENLAIAVVYFLVAKLCQMFAIKPGNVTPIWASSGICFIWVYIRGYHVLPGVFFGAFLGNVTAYIFPLDTAKLLLGVSSGIFNGTGDLLCTYVGVHYFKKFNQGRPILYDLKSAALFVFLSTFGGAFISALFGVTGLWLFDFISMDAYTTVFSTWLVGDAMGILILVPFLENVLVHNYHKNLKLNLKKFLETIPPAFIIFYLLYISLGVTHMDPIGFNMPIFIIMPLLAVGAFRHEEILMNLLLLIVSTYAIYLTINQVNFPVGVSLNDALLYTQVFIFSIVSSLYFGIAAINKIHTLNKQMIRSDRLKNIGVMAAGMAHEINNPLAIIDGSLKILERKNLNDDQFQTYTHKIDNSVQRISKIVDGLRKYSYQKDTVELREHNLSDIFSEVEEYIHIKSKKENVPVHFKDPQGTRIYCDDHQIYQVLVNLINNAIDAVKSHSDRWVIISSEKLDGMASIYVKDSGEGIDPDVLESLFNPFFTTKKKTDGTGLGLSISKGIVEDHGGSLTYKKLDGHTTFIVTLKTS